MGIRGELFSTRVLLQNRTYFFNVKENRLGDLYLNIVESKNRDEGGFERQSVILFAEDLQEFLKGFDESLRVLEKAVREKRKGKKDGVYKPKEDGPREDRPDTSDRFYQKREFKNDAPRQKNGQGKRRDASGPGRPRHSFKNTEHRSKDTGPRPPAPGRKKRVVVKKD